MSDRLDFNPYSREACARYLAAQPAPRSDDDEEPDPDEGDDEPLGSDELTGSGTADLEDDDGDAEGHPSRTEQTTSPDQGREDDSMSTTTRQATREELLADPQRAFPNTRFGPTAAERHEASKRRDRVKARQEGRGPEQVFPATPGLAPTAAEDERAEAAYRERWGSPGGAA